MRLRYVWMLGLALVLILATPAAGQDAQVIDGTADFRNPPVLRPGTYQDTIVTGETVWYAVVYTNDVAYRVDVSIEGQGSDSPELDLGARFIGPTLDSVGERSTLLEGSARYSGGDTNVWYIQVSLLTSARLGVEYKLSLDVGGVNDARLQRCDDLPDCTANDELAVIEEEIAAIEPIVAKLPQEMTEFQMKAQVDQMRSDLDDTNDEIEDANNVIADICSPEDNCVTALNPGSATSTVGLIVGGFVLVGGLALAGLQVARRR